MYSTKPEADHQSQMSVTQNQGSEQRYVNIKTQRFRRVSLAIRVM